MIEHLNAARDVLQAEDSLFSVTETEVRGIPMRVFSKAPATMRDLWALAAFHGDKTYIVYEDERYTYAEIDAQVRALAHLLRNEYGVASGDRVALSMRNYPEWVVSYWAIVSVGAAVVGMNAWWTGPEMEYGLTDSAPKVLIVDGERLERVVAHLDTVRAKSPLAVIAVRAEGDLPDGAVRWDDVVDAANAPAALPDAEIDPDDDATIFYTSGTTGFPKGAQLTHRGSVHNIMHIAYMPRWLGLAVAMEDGTVDAYQAEQVAEQPQLVFMAPTPLFHVTACNCLMHPATMVGAKLVLTYKWDAGRALELIEREGVTNFSGVPTMSREMLMHPDWNTRDTSTLVGMGGGGAPLHADLVAKIDQSLKNEKASPSTGYGLTETHGIVTANSSRTYLAKPESCGPLVPTLEAKLVDELGNELPSGPDTVGQLCVRGPVVIKGYINRPEATAEAIVDGWFNTGDVARIDDEGFVYIVDRAKDMVLRGGENVYSSEVETAIYQHPAVAEAAVFGIPDDRLGEDVACAIVLREGHTLTADELREFLAPILAKHKIPGHIWFRTEALPQNANGKFLKRELRDAILAENA
ncbi:MAG: AMP-binding protein [Acidimicrobiales bacterium]